LNHNNTGEAKNMTKKFQPGRGPWQQYRAQLNLSGSDEIDLHFGKRDPSLMSFREAMAGVTELVVASLNEARRKGRCHVMFIHGSSTSRRGKTTARSQVRNFMRSKHATPLIDRSGCIEHGTVFVAKLKPIQRERPADAMSGGI
jgi:DNA-nicking Smr family endonuclease